MWKKSVFIVLICAAAVAEEPASKDDTTVAPPSITTPAPGVSWTEEYTVGPGDTFSIELYGKPETKRLIVPIQPDGTITFLQGQNILVQGMTIEGMRAELQKTLTSYFKNIEVIVQPVTLQSKRYFILGRVVTKGAFVLDHPITVVEAVAQAKGFESSLLDPNTAGIADLSRSFIVRNGKKLNVNMEKLFLEGDFSQNVQVEPNDYLFFPSAESKEVYVLGAVNQPGKLDYLPGASVMSALAAGGGFTIEAFRDNVLVIRGSLNNPETIVVDCNDILKGREKDLKLQPKDIVYVSTRPWKIAEDLMDVATTAFVQSAINFWAGKNIIIGRDHVMPQIQP